MRFFNKRVLASTRVAVAVAVDVLTDADAGVVASDEVDVGVAVAVDAQTDADAGVVNAADVGVAAAVDVVVLLKFMCYLFL